MTNSTPTVPEGPQSSTREDAPRLVVAPVYKDPVTGETYVHQDLRQTQVSWAEEDHIRPFKASERFGDVESWAEYVNRYVTPGTTPFLTWNAAGLHAVLDYSASVDKPGRHQVTAECPFIKSIEWQAWRRLADGTPIDQAAVVERLEDLGADIVDPLPADLMSILRSLRKTVGMISDSAIKPDGTATISFSSDTTVRAGVKSDGSPTVDLPSEFQIGIPVLKGHMEAKQVAGKDVIEPVRYKLAVRIRVADNKDRHLVLRLSMPRAEQTLEDVFLDRVTAARTLLGPDLPLLRAAD